jgi:hemoglobin
METKTDIKTEEDIKTLIHSFYAKVRKDELLAPIFNEIIKGDWTEHLDTMCKFWSTMVLYTRTYNADPMSKHFPLPLTNEHFVRWIYLFQETVDDFFEGKVATDAKQTADNIGRLIRNVKGIPFQN